MKVYELTAEEIEWEVEPGRKVKAWAYNGQVPGPQIRVREGDRVRVDAQNKLSQSTAIHFHGLELPERPGRRAVHHPAAGQAGRELHLRVHRAQRRLAHVPLAPQRGDAGGQRAARRLHRRAEATAPGAQGRRGLRDGAERRRRTATRSTARASPPRSRSSASRARRCASGS